MSRRGSGANWRFLAAMKRGYTRRQRVQRAVATVEMLEDRQLLSAVNGSAFIDYDNDGLQNTDNAAAEVGIGGIVVRAYGPDDALVANATTNADGSYSLANPDNVPLRVEFSIPTQFSNTSVGSATGQQTTNVVFLDGQSDTIVNYGIRRPEEVTDGSIDLVTTCFVFGDGTDGPTGGSEPAIISFDYTSEGLSPAYTTLATYAQVGSVSGLAYQRELDTHFAGAHMKRHSGFGPGGTGAIYYIEGDNDPAVLTTLPNAADPHPTSTIGDATYVADWRLDAASFDEVGKIGLGDLDLSEDGTRLWTINLHDRMLYEIPIGTDDAPLDFANRDDADIQAHDFIADILADDADALGINPQQNARPFGLGVQDGMVYIGLVNSAQYDAAGVEGNLTADDLQAYVYRFDPTDPGSTPQQVLSFALNYERQAIIDAGFAPYTPGGWNPWGSEWPDTYANGAATPNFDFAEVGYAVPILSDIEFDNDGSMILGFRDRFGDQGGNVLPRPDGVGGNVAVDSGGDILRANFNGAGWTIEDLSYPYDASNPPASNDLSIEFYSGEVFGDASFGATVHNETGQGGLVQVPGYSEIVTTAMDPIDNVAFSGGLIFLDNTTGAESTANGRTQGLNLFTSPFGAIDTYAKANGLGDLEFADEAAETEIGNRIWFDTNEDGIQTAGEPAVPDGVTVQLYDMSDSAAPILVGTTTTIGGEYYFNDANVSYSDGGPATGLRPFTDYEVRLTTADFAADGVLSGARLTAANSGADNIDSDASIVDGVAVVTHTTGQSGENNHDLDIGLLRFDFGDLTEGYGTARTDDGARHIIDGQTFLGTGVDDELDGAASGDATGDGTDEDGVVFNTPLVAGSPASLTVTASKAGFLNAWIDFNSNGTFESAEQIADGLALSEGENTLTIAVPEDATGTMAARFRFTCDNADLTPTGAWHNGEVEDYVLGSIGNLVWLDNGADGGTAEDGIQNGAEPGLPGVTVYLLNESDQRVQDADGNDITAVTDENGLYEFAGLPAGNYAVEIPVTENELVPQDAGGDDELDSDINPVSGISGQVTIAPGTNIVSLDAGVVLWDRGDLPDEFGTTIASDGAQHFLDGVTFLGSTIDADTDGQPSSSATADGSDEDGVVFDSPLIAGQTAQVTVTASKAGYLNAWIDFNSNGAFDDGEQIASDLEVSEGANILTIVVPDDATGTMAARFRLTCDNPNGALGATGAWNNGEVEDYILGAIGDKVWLDNGAGDGVGADGLQNGDEPAVAGVIVNLLKADGTPVLNAAGESISTITDDAGMYEFAGLIPGDYRVEFELPSGHQFTNQGVGGDVGVDSDANELTGITEVIVIGAGVNNSTIDAGIQEQDFGDLRESYGTLAADNGAVHGLDGQTFLGTTIDAEVDGQPSDNAQGDGADEDGVVFNTAFLPGTIASATVTASKDGYLNAWIDFNEDGEFGPGEQIAADFALTAGENIITFEIPDGVVMENLVARFRFTCDNPNGSLGPVGPWDNGEVEDYVRPLGRIGDFVWFDADGDGAFNPGVEVGYPGVTVTLTGDTDNDGVDEIYTQVTDENGEYEFTGLPLIDWVVSVVPPSGTTNTYDNDGGLDGTSGTTLTEDQHADPDQDFGLKGTGAIGDTVFLDANENGVQDDGEIGLPGVPVSVDIDLDGNGDTDLTMTTRTGSHGKYSFGCLPAGSYTVTITPILGLVPTTDHTGDDVPDVASTLTLGPGESNLEQDFGLSGPGRIGDTIFVDDDHDDRLDDGEGAAGVTVILTADLDGDGVLERWSTETDANGEYQFQGLPVAGGISYDVTVDTSTLPPEYTWNTVDPDDGTLSTSTTTLTEADPIDNDQDFGYVEVPHDLGVSAKEQLMLEIINLARQNPAAAAAAFGIDLNDGLDAGTITDDAKQPLAPTAQLFEAAALRAAELIGSDPFGAEDSGARVAAGISTLDELAGLTGSDLISLGISAFGPIGAFNVFAFGDVNLTNTDSAGRVAVGGNATLTNFGVASGLLNPVAQQFSLMVGGTLQHTGEVFEGDTITGADVPLDFAALQTAVTQLSGELGALPDTGTTDITSARQIFIDATGSSGGLNVFSLNAADLEQATQFDIDADAGETVIVNVIGEVASFGNFQMRVNGRALQQGEEAPFELLFNFPAATNLTSTGFSWQGHVLAPNATYQFDNGHINGQLIVNNLSGTGEAHDFYFDGVMPYTLGHYCPDQDVHSLLFLSAQHRAELLSPDANEAGVAFDFSTYTRWDTEFDSAIGLEVVDASSDTYITGVVFDDSINDNDFYDIGEGIAHPSITAIAADGTEFVAATAESGGYSIQVPNGTYSVIVKRDTDQWFVSDVVVDGLNKKVDFDIATATRHTELQLEIDAPYVREKGAVTARVTRSGDLTEAYTVNIATDGDVTVANSVTIPAGASFAEFEVAGVDDDDPEGTESLTLTISGAGSFGAVAELEVREVEKLLGSSADGGDRTGHAIAIDGDWAIVGARFADDAGVSQSGKAYVYHRTADDTWVEVAVLESPNKDNNVNGGDRFGSAVAISGDTIAVGAVLEEGSDATRNEGAVYIFKRDAGGSNAWGLAQELVASDGSLGDQFGNAIAIDGDKLVIGARIDDGARANTGSVYVFERDGVEADFAETAHLWDESLLRSDQFGYDVDISGDRIVVGAPFVDTDAGGTDTGRAYVYERVDAANWELARRIEAPNPENNVSGGDRFGYSVAIEGDVVVVGAYSEENSGADLSSGAAYVFRKDKDGANSWGQVARLQAEDSAKRDHFGFAVDIDNNRILVGSRLKSTASAVKSKSKTDDTVAEDVVKSGAAYLFERVGSSDTWNQIDKLVSFDAGEKDYAGSAVALSGDYSLIGVLQDDDLGGNSGSAYAFHNQNSSPLLAASAPTSPANAPSLRQDELRDIVDAAKYYWQQTGLSDTQRQALDSFAVSISDLRGLRLGEGNQFGITLDDDAAGHGWYVDQTPYDLTDDTIGQRMDLLTVVKHEIGHVLGFADTYDRSHSEKLMYGYLSEGERRSVFSDLNGLFDELELM